MSVYMRTIGLFLTALGIAGSIYCWRAANDDEAYYRALRGFERYPGNVLYLQELKMAEPRHMLLLTGAFSAAPTGVVLGGICLALGSLLVRRQGEG